MELTIEEVRALLNQQIKRVQYDGKGERPYEAMVCAIRESVAAGNRPTSTTVTAATLEDIRQTPGGPRVETRSDGKFNLWTPFGQLEVETTAERDNHCTLYDAVDRIVAEVELGAEEIAEPEKHGALE